MEVSLIEVQCGWMMSWNELLFGSVILCNDDMIIMLVEIKEKLSAVDWKMSSNNVEENKENCSVG